MELVSPGIGLIFWMTLSFGIVLFLLAKFAWSPIMKALHDREHHIDEALHAADLARQEMEGMKFSNEQMMRQAKDERDVLLKETRKITESIKDEARQQAQAEYQRIIESARINIENEKMAAITELKNQLGHLSIEIAEKILREKMTKSAEQDAFIKKLLEEVELK
ncbi:MAG: F0F1 ATP synthase subunit B [Bacteroidota bacterium]